MLLCPEGFELHWFGAQKDLLDWVKEHVDSRVLAKVGRNPERWIDELNLIHQILTGDTLTCLSGSQPPVGLEGWRQIGARAFRYLGEYTRERGLWVLDKRSSEGSEYWHHYSLGTRSTVCVSQRLGKVDPTVFLPANFLPQTALVQQNRRQVRRWTQVLNGREVTIYAKEAVLDNLEFFYQPPSYRLTKLASARRLTSVAEHERFQQLAKLGVSVPETLAIYSSLAEDWLFVEGIPGNAPSPENEHRETVIRQDAAMLAALCRLGQSKAGFTDPQDKVFDGQTLHLIDCDEVFPLYAHYFRTDFRAVLQDPKDTQAMKTFRQWQRRVFLQVVRDTIWEYRENLLPTLADQELYLEEFANQCGFRLSKKEKQSLLRYKKDHTTVARTVAMMTEGD